MTELAIIGGTGFAQLDEFEVTGSDWLENQYGKAYTQYGVMAGREILFLPRHGQRANRPPHRINYRANIQALSDLGIKSTIGLAAVGSVDPEMGVGAIVIPDQLIDYTSGRAGTFYDDEIHHIDLTYPYDESLRISLIQAFKTLDDCELFESGTYGCTQGPRLETAAEIKQMAIAGCTIAGMTAMPEAALAREKDIGYGCIAMVVNAGAGLNAQAVDLSSITAVMDVATKKIVNGLKAYLRQGPGNIY